MTERSPIDEETRAMWRENPVAFPIERYASGYPAIEDGKLVFRPWPEGSDMGDFARKAAEAMHEDGNIPYPPDVYYLALSLRRIYVLESLGLPADPRSVNVVRQIEALASKGGRMVATAGEIMEAVASFALNMGNVRLAKYTADSKKAELGEMLEKGRYRVVGAMPEGKDADGKG